MADAVLLSPRAACKITYAIWDGTAEKSIQTEVIPNRVQVSKRAHTKAGECELTFNALSLPVDPRVLDGAFIEVYYAALSSMDGTVTNPQYLRFVGWTERVETERGKGGLMATMKARDISAVLRDRILPPKNTPRYSDTVGQAIARVLSTLPDDVGDAFEIRQDASTVKQLNRTLASLMHKRASTAHLEFKEGIKCWEAIESVCDKAALLVSVELGDIVVRAPSEAFTDLPPPAATFAFGGDDATLLDVKMDRQVMKMRKPITVVAYNTDTGETLTSTYAPDLPRNFAAAKKPAGAHKSTLPGAGTGVGRLKFTKSTENKDNVIAITLHGVQSQASVDAYAKRIWDERSRCELEIEVTTPIWDPEVLGLQNGDRVRLAIRPDLENRLRNTKDEAAAIAVLQSAIGISQDAAALLWRASRSPMVDLFYVDEAIDEFNSSGMATTRVKMIGLTEIVAPA